MDRFDASRLKIWRARVHIRELQQAIDDYNANGSIQVGIWPGMPGYVEFRAEVLIEPPRHLPAIIGDIIHNLRVSLDLLASDLVRLNDRDPANVYFPFAESGDELEKMIKRRNMHLAAPEVVELMKSFKPYKGGNAALRAVHDLDIRDKHQMLIPAAGNAAWAFGGFGWHSLADVKVGAGVKGVRLGDWPIGEGQHVTLTLLFPPDTPFGGNPMIPVFESLADDFLGLVHAFETLCFGAVAEGDW